MTADEEAIEIFGLNRVPDSARTGTGMTADEEAIETHPPPLGALAHNLVPD